MSNVKRCLRENSKATSLGGVFSLPIEVHGFA
jgi:hypothetical protein